MGKGPLYFLLGAGAAVAVLMFLRRHSDGSTAPESSQPVTPPLRLDVLKPEHLQDVISAGMAGMETGASAAPGANHVPPATSQRLARHRPTRSFAVI